MASDNEKRVIYRAIADFSAVQRAARRARREMRELRREEAKYNAQSIAQSKRVASAADSTARATNRLTASVKNLNNATKQATTATTQHAKAAKQNASAQQTQAQKILQGVAAQRKQVAAARAAATAANRHAASTKQSTAATTQHTTATTNNAKAQQVRVQKIVQGVAAQRRQATVGRAATNALNQNTTATNRATTAAKGLANQTQAAARGAANAARGTANVARAARNAGGAAQHAAQGMAHTNRQGNLLTRTFQGLLPIMVRVNKGFQNLGNWRPRLVPPFIALIPAILGVLSLLNPLVAGLGAVGGAAIGLASSLGRVGGAALAAIPGLVTLLSVVGALKVAMGGVGNAFTAFRGARDASRRATTTAARDARQPKPIELADLTLQEKLTRANEAYRRSVQNVRFAQDDLNEARKGYIRRLHELERAVKNAGLTEMRAAANAQLAYEDYRRTLADPNASQGDRMAAEVEYLEALEAQKEVSEENKKNAQDLADMQSKGMNGDRDVIMAQRGVTDALDAVRDAQLELINVRRRDAQEAQTAALANQRAANAVNDAWAEYNDVLNKLSPSARSVVEQLIGMEGAWGKLKRAVQEAFFSKFVDDVKLLYQLLPPLQSMLEDTAGAAGEVVSDFIQRITSPEWGKDLILLGEGNVPIIENVGTGLLNLLDTIRILAVIVQPFLEALSEGFLKGTENLKEMVTEARESGSLGKWLMGDGDSKGVLDTLRMWWQIIKNIGKTIGNYSGAAKEFSEWITEGLLNKTERWLQASRDAKKEGSPFKVWLEDIKPLLEELDRMFGNFFKWFAETAADPENIESMTNIIRLITDELGPALDGFFDKMADSDVGEKFIETLVKLVEIIEHLADSGAVEVFFDTLNWLLDIILRILDMPGAPEAIGAIFSALSMLAALSFVGKFTGLSRLIGMLLSLATGGKALPGLIRGIAGALGLLPAAAGGAVPRRAAGGAGGRRGGAAPRRAAGGVGGPGGPAAPRHGRGGGGWWGGGGGGAAQPRRAAGARRAAAGTRGGGWWPWGGGTTPQRAAGGVTAPAATRTPQRGVGVPRRAATGGLFRLRGAGRFAAPFAAMAGMDAVTSGLLAGNASRLGGTTAAATAPARAARPRRATTLRDSIRSRWAQMNATPERGSVRMGAWFERPERATPRRGMAAEPTAPRTPRGQRLIGGAGRAVTGAGRAVGGGIGRVVGGAGRLVGGAGRLLGGPAGIASLGGMIIGDAISGSAAQGRAGASQRLGGNTLSGAASGAGIGAMLGSVVPGVGTAIGAAAGGAIGGAVGFFGSPAEDRDTFLAETGEAFGKFFTETIPDLGKGIWDGLSSFGDWVKEQVEAAGTWLSGLPEHISNAAGDLYQYFQGIGPWFEEKFAEARAWLSELPYKIGYSAGQLWAHVENFGDWLGRTYENAKAWLEGLPERTKAAVGNLYERFMTIKAWFTEQWVNAEAWLKGLPERAKRAAGDIYRNFLTLGIWLSNQWNAASTWMAGLPQRARNAAGDIFRNFTGIGQWLANQAAAAVDWAKRLPGTIKTAFDNGLSSVGTAWNNFWGQTMEGARDGFEDTRRRRNGGIIRRRDGGSVPGAGNSDTVDAKLTPGEFVLRKEIVNRIGPENLVKLNSGIMTFTELLQHVSVSGPRRGSGRKALGGRGLQFFNAGGLVPDMSRHFDSTLGISGTLDSKRISATTTPGGRQIIIKELNIHNPVRETSEQSLRRSVRKLDYAFSGGDR